MYNLYNHIINARYKGAWVVKLAGLVSKFAVMSLQWANNIYESL